MGHEWAGPVNLILDTDLDTDCDDVGALAVLETLSRRGDANPLGVVCSVPVRWAASCAGAVLEAFGRAVPVGLVAVSSWDHDDRFAAYRTHRARAEEHYGGALYNESIGAPWQATHPDWTPEEAVALYRRLLASEADGAVTICAIGTLTALAELLESEPDVHSPLTGEQLVRVKVRQLVTMAEAPYPEGCDCFNWAMDKPAAAAVVNGWPGRLTVSRWGAEVLTGAEFSRAARPGHAAGEAYVIHREGRGVSRCSWDQLALLYAVRGPGELFARSEALTLTLDAGTGAHCFGPLAQGAAAGHHLTPRVDADELARVIEGLMLEALR